MRPAELLDSFDIDPTPIWPEDDGRLEPIFLDGPLWIEFDAGELVVGPIDHVADDELLLVGFDEFALNEPAGEAADQPEGPQPAPPSRPAASGLAYSLTVHLLVLLALLAWSNPTGELAGAIPVQLVLEQAAEAPKQTAPGQQVAEDGEAAAKSETVIAEPQPPPTVPPPEDKVATAAPPPSPVPPPQPKPAAPPVPKVAAHPAAPPPPPRPAATAARSRAPAPIPAVATAAVRAQPVTASISSASSGAATDRSSGAGKGRGDYFAELEKLTRPYLYMLSPAFLGGRRGKITLSILVRDDGSISGISVKRSSGYPDIDHRIEQMIAAVGTFPPLPDGLRRPGADFDFNLVFPEVLQQ